MALGILALPNDEEYDLISHPAQLKGIHQYKIYHLF